MKKLIFMASLMALLIVCLEGCGKDNPPAPTPTGGATTGSAPGSAGPSNGY